MAGKLKGMALGRGLEALFADQESIEKDETKEAEGIVTEPENRVEYISINDIKPNKSQPRKTFNEEKIKELADSILEHGIIQPLVVRASSVGYELVAGERRWRAAREAGLKEVPCLIRNFTDEENMLVAIIENMQREDLNPIEEAEGLERMIKTYGLTQEQVSRSVSKSRPYIANALRLLNLPEDIRGFVAKGDITAGHARAILAAGSEKKQRDLCREIIAKGLSVREAERLATGEKPTRAIPRKKVKDKDVASVENELRDIFGTKISINPKAKGGVIELAYYSTDELNRLIDMLRTAKRR